MEDLFRNIGESLSANAALGDDPSTEEIREFVRDRKAQGQDGMTIGKNVGLLYVAKRGPETDDILDRLETVLTEEFEDYGTEA